MFSAQIQEEGGHRGVLEVGARKVGREATPRAAARDLWWTSRRATDASDIGTFKITTAR